MSMGDFAEVHFRVRLKSETPIYMINLLKYMMGRGEKPTKIPTDPLFNYKRWGSMLSAQADDNNIAKMTNALERIHNGWNLVVTSVFRDTGEIEAFFNWISNYLMESWLDYVGYIKYDTSDHPILIYNSFNGIQYLKVDCDEEDNKDDVLLNWKIKNLK